MTSMRRSGRRGHSQASSPGVPSSSSPTIDDSPRSSTYSQDPEASSRVGGRLRSPKEDEEDPFE